MFLITPLRKVIVNLAVLTWDFWLEVINLITPLRQRGRVTPVGAPGEGGKWPEYVAPRQGDSRCACPALNAMANHGILPRDGKDITFRQMNAALQTTYNCAPSFCFFVPHYASEMLKRSYWSGKVDLAELDLHNGIEHDASLFREDSALVPDQGKPHVPFVKELLGRASGKDKDGSALLTVKDISDYSAKRRVDARRTNPKFTLDFVHKVFGSSNSSTLLTLFGGRVNDLESFLVDERLPEGWESSMRKRLGMTILSFNFTVLKVERGIDERKYEASLDKATEPGSDEDQRDGDRPTETTRLLGGHN